MEAQTDRIVLKATRARVWRALTSAEEFGFWFGVKLDGPFQPGRVMRGTMQATKVDDKVAAMQKQFEGFPFEITIEQIVPERLFSFRWHPNAIERGVDYSNEPTTLIEFVLDDAPGGVLLTVTESGFDRIPLERRAKAFTSNEEGWTLVVTLVEKHLAQTS